MNKPYHIAIAEVLHNVAPKGADGEEAYQMWETITAKLSVLFTEKDPKFNHEAFVRRCVYGDKK